MPRKKSKLKGLTNGHYLIMAMCTGEGRGVNDLFHVAKRVLNLDHAPSMTTELIGGGYLRYNERRIQTTEAGLDALAHAEKLPSLIGELQLLARLSDASGSSMEVIINYAEQIQSLLGK